MKALSILIPILVGFCSILLFRDRVDDIVASLKTTYDRYSRELFAAKQDIVTTTTTTTTTAASARATGAAPELQHPETHLYATDMSVPRAIRKVFLAVEQAEGAGARVRRSVGTPALRNFSPFLMLDHFSIKPGAGFPDHPHRGQETITYLLTGGVDHEDFAGNKGTIEAGDLQFMTAGKGIVHAEMPRQNPDGSANVGLQLWVDLPKHLKSCEPRYRDLRAKEIPAAEADDGKVKIKVISGQSHGVDSVKDLAYTPVWILDVEIKPGGKVAQPLPEGWNAFAYVLEGADVKFRNGSSAEGEGEVRAAPQYHNVVFEPQGEAILASVDGDAAAPGRFVLVAGTPLDQKVVQYGPFVVNSMEEVQKAMFDFHTHSNGFERAKDWQSEIGKSMRD
ncbi:pirin [Gaeumannomyces tritici R3-111a-1]|uniref:Pirin n=1 Tax=Gaeumannomyces tritici (strain R3-111a-1) TaxID=644352 RepID=J3PBE3_GAET3|nr:pirin [Gaeumannomyces tritici R3-111a-1]EJT71560.1 pirin [Gaeumannomyces tritici R3-111a-1]